MYRSLLPASLLVGAFFAGAAAAQSFSDRSGDPIAPGTGLDGPLDARELAQAMFEAARAEPKQIVRQRLETARKEAHVISERDPHYADGKSILDDGLGWSKRLLAAELAVCDSPAEKAAAYKRHWLVAWEHEHKAEERFDFGQHSYGRLMAARYDRLTAEIDWEKARAGGGKEEPRPRAERLPDFRFPESNFDGMNYLTPRARAKFEASRSDVGVLARQRVEAARVAYRERLEEYERGKTVLLDLLTLAESVTQAELDVPGGTADETAVRERAWEMAWVVHEITRMRYDRYGLSFEARAPARYALLQAEIALLRAGQIMRPNRVNRVGSIVNNPDLAKILDAKALARARTEVGRTDLNDLLRLRLEAARDGYRLRMGEYLEGKTVLDSLLDWLPRMLDSELALAANQTAREAAHVRHWKRSWQIEAVNLRKFEAGKATIVESMQSRYARLDAELLWAQARQTRK